MPYVQPRCEVVPLPDDQVSIRVAGTERLRWHFGAHYPRPFFYPLIGPSGSALTRMGHPGAANHDHHRSIWFAHNKVLGIDFWADTSKAFIRQKHWLCYQDGNDEAALAVALGWHDGHDPKELLEQELIVGVRPGPGGETVVELQATFRPTGESLEFGKTNFGFLAVRVAKSISEHFGGGKLTNSAGKEHEAEIFGKEARWVDYSGPVPTGAVEGITYFDHPSNPGHPVKWHVREDGWMGASVCMDEARQTTRKRPLTVRYLLHAHQEAVSAARADAALKEFSDTRPYIVVKANVKHTQFVIKREA
jgi:hypothetical protein